MEKRICNYLVFGRVTNEALCVVESHIAGCRSVTLVVCDDLNFAVLEDAHAGVSSS